MNNWYFKLMLIIFCFITFAVSATEKGLGFYRSKGLYIQGAAHCQKSLKNTQNIEEKKKIFLELAACYQFNTRDHTYRKAVEVYRQFIQKYRGDPLCAKAYFNIGRCYDAFTVERQQDIEKARKAYKACYEKYPASQWGHQAFFWHANSYLYHLTPKTATTGEKTLKEFLRRYPKSFLRGVVNSQLSELYCTWLNNYKAAVKHSLAALKYGIQDVKLRRLHLYRLAYLYQFKLKDDQNALKWYGKLTAESPSKSDPNYFVAKKRIKKLMSKLEKKK
jgi:tetratricopeptide (TPR) repeat protein